MKFKDSVAPFYSWDIIQSKITTGTWRMGMGIIMARIEIYLIITANWFIHTNSCGRGWRRLLPSS
jgi:hypothetical protein